jgi:spermidine/putrescine transport system substrate-binding protein
MKRSAALIAALAMLLLAAASPATAEQKKLFLFIWSEYLPDEILEQFTSQTGIKVMVSTYDSNEAMYAKLKMSPGHDLAVPSTDFVSRMRNEGMLIALDKKKLPNLKHVGPRFMDRAFDPGNAYSVPYMWGTTAVAVNTALMPSVRISTWDDLWKPELKGRLLLPNDMRSVMGIGLKSLGYSLNDTDPEHLRQAYEKLKPLMGSVKVFDSDSPKQAIINREVAAGVMWNGEAYVANQENPKIVYVYPQDGFGMWIDSLVIPKGARNVEAAHKFIDFLLRPEIAAAISEDLGYATPNQQAKSMLTAKARQNPIIYPPDEILDRSELEIDLGAAIAQYERYWTLLKTGE